jgi:hypothetical protein
MVMTVPMPTYDDHCKSWKFCSCSDHLFVFDGILVLSVLPVTVTVFV